MIVLSFEEEVKCLVKKYQGVLDSGSGGATSWSVSGKKSVGPGDSLK